MPIRDTEKTKFFTDKKRKPLILNAVFTSLDDAREIGQRIRKRFNTDRHTHASPFVQ